MMWGGITYFGFASEYWGVGVGGSQPEALKSTQDERVTMRTVSNFLEQSVIVRNALSHGHVAVCVGSTMFRVSRE